MLCLQRRFIRCWIDRREHGRGGNQGDSLKGSLSLIRVSSYWKSLETFLGRSFAKPLVSLHP